MIRRSLSIRILAAIGFSFAAAVFSVGTACAQQADPLAGKWKMVSSSPDGNEIPWTLTIKLANGKYDATCVTDAGEQAVKDLNVDGHKLHFRVPYQGEDYDIDLKLEGGSLAGTWSGSSGSGATKGQKAPA